MVTTDRYDFKGNLLRTQRQLATEYKKTLDWPATGLLPLETAVYKRSTSYDALNRPVETTEPDNSVIGLVYNEANLIERIEARLRGAATATPFITDIDYDAKGQRTLIDYGNGVRTTYEYDRETFRLKKLLTTRGAALLPPDIPRDDCPSPPLSGWPGCQVQNLHYAYDPAGNITSIRDDAQQKVYFDNRRVEPSAEYTYDATYRLIEATGREHLGGLANPTPPDPFNGFHTRIDHPGNGNAMGTYAERYFYDSVGNIMSVRHRGSDPAAGWRRCYQYATDSNRLLSTSNPADPHNPDDPCAKDYADTPFYAEKYEYDAHGNMTRMPHLPLMKWDYRDQLQASSKQVVTTSDRTPETTWYVYDASGQRVRKVTESEAIAPATPVRKTERIYIGGFEVYREYNSGGGTVKLERETLHIMDDKQRVALVETRTDTASPEQLIRYQFGNHLGSAALELDDKAQIISYEEYYPYGSTSYQAARSKTEAAKRYRYTGKERDEESGLYYHGARYYAPWLGKWISCDPVTILHGVKYQKDTRAGGSDDSNVAGNSVQNIEPLANGNLMDLNRMTQSTYSYCLGRTITHVDMDGREPKWGQLGRLSDVLREFDRAVESLPANATEAQQLAALTSHFEANRMYTRDAAGNLVDATHSRNVKRYIFTSKGGWIDLHHFFKLADKTRTDGVNNAFSYAFRSEQGQFVLGKGSSAFSYEDLPSNAQGIQFWLSIQSTVKQGKFTDLRTGFGDYLLQQGARDPRDAPNFDYIPYLIPEEAPSITNQSTRPILGEELGGLAKAWFNRLPATDQQKLRAAHRTIDAYLNPPEPQPANAAPMAPKTPRGAKSPEILKRPTS